MSQFKIDYSRLTLLLVPSFLRSSRLLLLLRAAIHGVDSVYGLFTINRNDNLFRLSNNSQVCYLEHVLNYKYDQKEHKIRIDDYSAYGTLSYIYWEVNGDGTKDTSNDHMKIYQEPTAASTADDITAYTDNTPILCSEVALATGVTTFNVMIAKTGADVDIVYNYINDTNTTDQAKLTYRRFCALINTYKLAGKKYKIIPYTPKTTT